MTGPLDGRRPVFLVHRSHQGGGGFGRLVGQVVTAAGAGVEVGAVAKLSRQTEQATRGILESATGAGLRIADPELHDVADIRLAEARLARAPYLRNPLPTRPNEAFIRNLLERQRQVGATVLLTPTGIVGDALGERALAETIRWVSATRALGPAEPLAVSLTLSRGWLTTPALLEALLNEIVDSTERIWYLRIRWEALQPRYGQLRDPALLAGYKALASTASSEGKLILLPQTALTGWLATALGAGGLSTGLAAPEQAFADTVQIRIQRGQRRPARPRYFEPSLLHTVDLATHTSASAHAGYVPCPCVYCDELGLRGGGIDPARWTRDVAGRHQVVAIATLLGTIATQDRRHEAQALVTNARATEADLTPTPVGENRARHLEVWDPLLR